MNVLDAIRKRREITHYQNKPIPQEDLEQVLDAAYLAPTGNNLPSREFILVTGREKLKSLSQATPFMPWLAKAAAGIVITARPDVSKYWLQDASIASGFIWLAATQLGIGSAFGAIYHAEDQHESAKRENVVRKALSIPEDRRVVAIIGLGYAEKEPDPKTLVPRESIIHYEEFKNSKGF